MPEKSASSQVRPNTPGAIGQAPIQSGQGGPAQTPLEAVDQSHGKAPAQSGAEPARTVQAEDAAYVADAQGPDAPDPDSPGAKLARDKQAEQDALGSPGAPHYCTTCGVLLIAAIELAGGPFDPDTGEQLGDVQETGGNEGAVAVIQCPQSHETWRRQGSSWERTDTRMTASQEKADAEHGNHV